MQVLLDWISLYMIFAQRVVGGCEKPIARNAHELLSNGKLVQEGQSDLGEFERVAPAESWHGGGVFG